MANIWNNTGFIKGESGNGTGICVLFDYYMLQTKQDPEQKRRKQNYSTIEVNFHMNTLIPENNSFRQKSNKQKLIGVFSSYLIPEGITV